MPKHSARSPHFNRGAVRVLVTLCATLALTRPAVAQPLTATAVPELTSAWNAGGANELALTVRQYAQGFWIIRQGKRSSSEAPFMYLIAGRDSALLLDTGAAPERGGDIPLVSVVDSLLRTVDAARMWPLVVLHSHGHADHRYYDPQFVARARTHLIAADTNALVAQLRFTHWPDESPAAIQLGNRQLLVIATPGHQSAHVMVYDATTAALLSGDMLYPGLLTVRDLPAFRASTARLRQFRRTHPIRHILGAHVEMTNVGGVMYPLGTIAQPSEHALALPGSALDSLHAAVGLAGDFQREVVHDHFILGRVQPPVTDRPATHGMLLFGLSRPFLSHLSMSRSPHNYQLVFEAELFPDDLRAYRADAAAHPHEIYTVEPVTEWVLPNTIRRDTTVVAHLYRGHFERGGVKIASNISVRVRQLVTFRRFDATDRPSMSRWFAVGDPHDRYLVHHVSGGGDVDQVVRLCTTTRGLRDGTQVRVGRVCRVVFTERGDLAH
jgi:glyoxylase-like metal-dependent hydrolase (beta-lactamase superfamily II)